MNMNRGLLKQQFFLQSGDKVPRVTEVRRVNMSFARWTDLFNMHRLPSYRRPWMLHADLFFEVVTLTWKFRRADWFRGRRCNLVMNTEKVKAASRQQSCSIWLHAVQNTSDNGLSLSASRSLIHSIPVVLSNTVSSVQLGCFFLYRWGFIRPLNHIKGNTEYTMSPERLAFLMTRSRQWSDYKNRPYTNRLRAQLVHNN